MWDTTLITTYPENEPTWTSPTNYGNDSDTGGIRTERVGCREYSDGGQSCVYMGIMCVLVNKEQAEYVTQPHVFFVDDTHKNYIPVASDKWCENRLGAGPAAWPPPGHSFAPRHSCMYARWRTYSSLIANMLRPVRVRWVRSMAFVPHDYRDQNDSHSFLTNNVWLLDTALWQAALNESLTTGPTRLRQLFQPANHVFMASSVAQFEGLSDMSRFLFALLMRLDVKRLYQKQTMDEEKHLWTRSLFEAFPRLKSKLLFFNEQRDDTPFDLVCTRRFTVGPKSSDLGDPRVCEYLRSSGWRLLGIKEPGYGSVGTIQYSRPPRKVVLLQRHDKGGIRNVEALTKSLKQTATKYGFQFELHSTESLKTAVEHVRLFAGIGVLLTPHGEHEIGSIWMPRHGAIIEIFPPRFVHLTYSLMARNCRLWYFDVSTQVTEDMREVYKEKCRTRGGYIFNTCTALKDVSFEVDVDKTVDTVLVALRRIGHDLRIVE